MRVVLAHQRAYVLRIEALAERGGPAHIGEEDGDELAFLALDNIMADSHPTCGRSWGRHVTACLRQYGPIHGEGVKPPRSWQVASMPAWKRRNRVATASFHEPGPACAGHGEDHQAAGGFVLANPFETVPRSISARYLHDAWERLSGVLPGYRLAPFTSGGRRQGHKQ